MPPFLVGALAVELGSELGLSAGAVGSAVSAFFLTAGALAILLGRRVDRFGWHSSVRIAASATILTVVGVALFATSWLTLVPFMILGGAGHALAMPASNLALARGVWRHRQALSFGVRQAAIPMTLMLAGLSVPAIALTVGWRWVFVAGVALPLAAFVLVPRQTTSRPDPDDEARSVPQSQMDGGEADRRHETKPSRMVFLSIAGGFAAATVGALSTFFVLGSVDAGLSSGSAGHILAVGSGLGLVVRVVGGWFADYFRFNGFRLVSMLLLLGSAGYVIFAMGGFWPIVLGSVLAFGGGWGWPGLFHFAVVDANRRSPGGATGIVQAGLSTGAALGPLAFGFVVERVPFIYGWVGLGALSVLSALLVYAARPSTPTRVRSSE